MYQVFYCLTVEHDLRLVALAVVLCTIAAFSAVATVRRAYAISGYRRAMWLAISGLVTGVGIWGTHFVSMLAYKTPAGVSYDMPVTIASLIIAIVFGLAGWAIVCRVRNIAGAALGGGTVGGGIAAMHFTGIDAMDAGFVVGWDAGFVIASLVFGVVGAATSAMTLVGSTRHGNLIAAGLALVLSVALMHYTAMAAMQLQPGLAPATTLTGDAATLIAITVSLAALMVVGLGLMAAVFDYHLGENKREEARRIRLLADSTFEGLVIVRNGLVRDMNMRFCEMLSLTRRDLVDMPLRKIAYDHTALAALESADDETPQTAKLRCRHGSAITVQVLLRNMDIGGESSTIFAMRDVSAEERAKAKIMHLAHHDPLTGLPNRLRFRECLEDELERAWDDGTEVAVMCFDLDRFKEVNDVHGHATGDALLVAVAERMQDCLPKHAIPARLSGDEFAVILPRCDSRLEAATVAQRVVNHVGSLLTLGSVQLNVSASGGVTVFPLDGEDPERLMNQADLALYRAKGQGRNCVCEFDPQLGLLMQERRMLEADLSIALEDELLDLHFQPQARLGDGELVGFEALVRWENDRRGYVPPSEFVQLAEETGQILKLGQWVLEHACREAMRWPDDRRVSVNVSPAQFKQGNLVRTVERALQLSGLSPDRLEIEITEGVLIDDEARALKVLRRLKELGVGLAIDDFGTGYASLGYLRAFPFDKIKIDRAFITGIQNDPEAQIIVRATIDLARQLGMGVIVEGVEDFDELAALGSQTDLLLQGYLLSAPITRGQIAGFDEVSADLRAQIAAVVAGRSLGRDVA